MQSEKDNNEEFVTKVFTNDDLSLKLLGELLSNQVSRDIIRLLIEKEMYANEIANRLDIQFSLILHHLKKMGELGLLSMRKKRIVRNGQMHKFYKINPGIFLLPSHTKDQVAGDGLLKKIFREGIKFAAIGFASFVSFVLTQAPLTPDEGIYFARGSDSMELTIPLLVLVIGLIIERIVTGFKKRKKGGLS